MGGTIGWCIPYIWSHNISSGQIPAGTSCAAVSCRRGESFLGKTYLEMRQKSLARAEFETVLRLPVASYFDTERKEEAILLLAEMR